MVRRDAILKMRSGTHFRPSSLIHIGMDGLAGERLRTADIPPCNP